MRNSYSEIRKYRYSVHSSPIVLMDDVKEKKALYCAPTCVAKTDPLPRERRKSLRSHDRSINGRRKIAQKPQGNIKKCNAAACELTGSISEYRQKQRDKYRVPDRTVRMFRDVLGTNDKPLILKLFRPKIYLDFSIRDITPLGRVHVQLFTEACPEVVLEFVSMCVANNASRFNFPRIFGGLWIEGEFKSNNGSLIEGDFTHDMRVVNHGSGSGILSFSKRYVEGFQSGIINFSISFKPLDVMNGERVAFGLVTRGNQILHNLHNRAIGSANNEVIVTQCGIF